MSSFCVGEKLLPSYDPPPPVSSVGSGRWAALWAGPERGGAALAGPDCVFDRGVVGGGACGGGGE